MQMDLLMMMAMMVMMVMMILMVQVEIICSMAVLKLSDRPWCGRVGRTFLSFFFHT